jgi:hypothetical protein
VDQAASALAGALNIANSHRLLCDWGLVGGREGTGFWKTPYPPPPCDFIVFRRFSSLSKRAYPFDALHAPHNTPLVLCANCPLRLWSSLYFLDRACAQFHG